MSEVKTRFYFCPPGGEPVEILKIENIEPISVPDVDWSFAPHVLDFEATFTGHFPVGFFWPCKIMKPQHRLIGRRSHEC